MLELLERSILIYKESYLSSEILDFSDVAENKEYFIKFIIAQFLRNIFNANFSDVFF